MLDPKFVRQNPEFVKQAMRNRGLNLDREIDEFCEKYDERKAALVKLDELRRMKKVASKLYHEELKIQAWATQIIPDDWPWLTEQDFWDMGCRPEE